MSLAPSESPFLLMLMTNVPAIAVEAVRAGVDRIFVDLEVRGKAERQRGRATIISGHTLEDVRAVRVAIGSAALLVRVNPPGPWTEEEVEGAIAAGADVLMLPYFTRPSEVESFVRAVRGRAIVCLLVETGPALARIEQLAAIDGVNEIHVGLNDLHASIGLTFMYELLASGLIDFAADRVRAAGRQVRFGFGGGALLDARHPVSPADVLREHARLGSEMIILSRTFTGDAASLEDLHRRVDLQSEVRRIREIIDSARRRSAAEAESDRRRIHARIWDVAAGMDRLG